MDKSTPEPDVDSGKTLAFQDKSAEPVGAQPSGQDPRKEAKQVDKFAKKGVKQIVPPVRQSDSSASKSTRENAGEKTASVSTAKQKTQVAEAATAKETGKMWTVQVGSFPDEPTATLRVDRLKSKGYDAYMVESKINEQTWYRVRVGRLVAQNEAEKLRQSLISKEKLTDSFLTKQ